MRARLNALVAWRDGGRHRFPVPSHYRIYVDGDDYVIGCHRTRCEIWRQPQTTIATLQLKEERPWLT